MAKNFHLKSWVFASFIGFGLSQPVMATMSVIESDNNLIAGAQLICAVTVISQKPEALNSIILTRSTVKPIKCFKGNPTSEFDIIVPGGKNKDKNTTVEGAPKLQVNESLILYLSRNSDSVPFGITNWLQGIIPLELGTNNQYLIPKKYGKKLKGLTLDDYALFIKNNS